MATDFHRIALIGRPDDERVMTPMRKLVKHLSKTGVELYSANLSEGVTKLPEEELAEIADLFIAVGGDGTMLYAGALAREHDVPLLGINRGRLGFLADVTPDEMLVSVDRILAGNFTRESRLLLEARLVSKSGDITGYAINDVVLQRRKTGRMVDFETRIGDRYVNTHAGDGLIVATPTGSTAYALSCGGPIIEPSLDALVLVPVAPHTLTDRPIVIPSDQPIDIRILERDDITADIAIDGVFAAEIKPGDRLTIGPSKGRVTLIHPPGYDYYDILRSKLYWGKDGRSRGTPDD